MKIVMDTNVLYQALRNQAGASNFILRLVRNFQLELALSIPVFLEYQDVLLRPGSLTDLQLTRADVETVLRLLAYVGKPSVIHFLMRPNLRDENDNMFIDLAVSSNSRFIITNNIADFTFNTDLTFDQFQVITPAQYVHLWRQENE